MSRIRILVGVGVILVGIWVVGAFAEQPESKLFKLSCVLFDHKDNQTVLTGHVAATKFEKWFKRDYGVRGERIETPKNATVFGALVLTDGSDIRVMPCYTWRAGQLTYFACQSHEIGHAPMFTVIETSQKAFVKSMKARLNDIGKAEQTDAPDKK